MADAGVKTTQVLGIGIGAPGPLDPNKGVILEAPNLKWRNVPLKKIVQKATGLSTVVDNDVNVGTLGEFKFGAGMGAKNLVGIFIGTGIGGGLILNGRLYRGRRGMAGRAGAASICPRRL